MFEEPVKSVLIHDDTGNCISARLLNWVESETC